MIEKKYYASVIQRLRKGLGFPPLDIEGKYGKYNNDIQLNATDDFSEISCEQPEERIRIQ
jgi:hypothetical protein